MGIPSAILLLDAGTSFLSNEDDQSLLAWTIVCVISDIYFFDTLLRTGMPVYLLECEAGRSNCLSSDESLGLSR